MHELLTQSRELFAVVDLSQWTEGMDNGARVFLTLAVLGALVLVGAFIVFLIDSLHRRNAEMSLKRDMLERGLSVDEMERLLAARPAKPGKLSETQPYAKK